jgi:hypothetical protein
MPGFGFVNDLLRRMSDCKLQPALHDAYVLRRGGLLAPHGQRSNTYKASEQAKHLIIELLGLKHSASVFFVNNYNK